MYPIDQWTGLEPPSDYIRLMAITIGAGLFAVPVMIKVGQGMLKLHELIPSSKHGDGRHWICHNPRLVIHRLDWHWCTDCGNGDGIDAATDRNPSKSRYGHHLGADYDLHVCAETGWIRLHLMCGGTKGETPSRVSAGLCPAVSPMCRKALLLTSLMLIMSLSPLVQPRKEDRPHAVVTSVSMS